MMTGASPRGPGIRAPWRPLPKTLWTARIESDARWHEEPFELFDDAGLFVALAEQVGERRLAQGIGLLLDKACFGDPGEMMRGLRHALEAACDSNWSLLADTCASRAGSARPGTRLWAMAEIAILRDPVLVGVIRGRLADVEPDVRNEAIRAASMLAQQHPSEARTLLPDLRTMTESETEAALRNAAVNASAEIGSASES